MKIYYRKVNRGEMYCCPLKKVKELFKDTEVTLNFGSFSRNYEPMCNEIGYSYFKKNIKGVVISELSIKYGIPNSMLSFYVIKENQFSTELQKEFENEVLNEILKFYKEYDFIDNFINKTTLLLIELLNNKLIIHKNII